MSISLLLSLHLSSYSLFFFFNDTATTEIYTLSLHDALPIWIHGEQRRRRLVVGDELVDADHDAPLVLDLALPAVRRLRSEEHTSELQSRLHLVCRLLLEKKKNKKRKIVQSKSLLVCMVKIMS